MAIWTGVRRPLALIASLVLILAGCGSDSETEAAANEDAPTVVVTTNILGDVVGEIVGDQANVITIMPVGADPHDFQPSAQEVDQLLEADALITNGSDFEEGLIDVIASAKEAGVPTFEATSAVTTIAFSFGSADDHDDHGDEAHDDGDEDHDEEEDHGDEDHDDDGDEDHNEEEDHDDEDHDEDEEDHGDEDHDEDEEDHGDEDHDDHGHDGDDPHFFTDPVRMADAVAGISSFLGTEVDGLDTAALETSTDAYLAELDALDAEVKELIDAIPEDRRVLITNHAVFGYFAEQYGFEVVGAVIPSGTTADSASAGELAELAEVIEHEGVPAIFADVSSSNALVETLAAEVGDIEVVELFSESLGDADSDGATYLSMVRTNAARISTALS